MTTQELIWKYAEGTCSPSELATIEKLLADDPTLQAELDMALEVQSTLTAMKPDVPSMRFTKNVMEALPLNLYPPLSEGLVKPIWKKIFWFALAAVAAGLFSLPNSSVPTTTQLPYADKLMEGFGSTIENLPPVTVQFFALTVIALLTLALVDKVFISRRA